MRLTEQSIDSLAEMPGGPARVWLRGHGRAVLLAFENRINTRLIRHHFDHPGATEADLDEALDAYQADNVEELGLVMRQAGRVFLDRGRDEAERYLRRALWEVAAGEDVEPPDPPEDAPWNPAAASRLLRSLALGARDESRHLLQNLDGYCSSEEEFVLGLEQGAGYDEDAVAELVRRVKRGGP